MPRDLELLLDTVKDEATFIAFVDALGADFLEETTLESAVPSNPYGSGALGWENGTVDGFLERGAA